MKPVIPPPGGGSGSGASATFSTALVAGQQSYAVTFVPALATNPTSNTIVDPVVDMASSSGDVLSASVDRSTLTKTGCTIWLSGLPSASAGTLRGNVFL